MGHFFDAKEFGTDGNVIEFFCRECQKKIGQVKLDGKCGGDER